MHLLSRVATGITTTFLLTSAAWSADMSATSFYQDSAAGPSPSTWDAYFSAEAGNRWIDVDGASFDDRFFGVRGSGAYAIGGGVGVQADLTYNRQYFGDSEIHSSDTDGAGHIFYRDPERGLIGIVGQVGNTDFSYGGIGIDFDRYYAGVEAQGYFGNFTLYGQIAYENLDVGPILGGLVGDADGWVATAQARYFVQPNWRVDGKVLYVSREFDDGGISGDGNLEVWGAGIGTEFKFTSVPVSAFANLDWTTASFGGGPDLDNTRAFAGLKLNLGTETLIERDRHGASLDPIPYEAPIIDAIGIESESLIGLITPP